MHTTTIVFVTAGLVVALLAITIAVAHRRRQARANVPTASITEPQPGTSSTVRAGSIEFGGLAAEIAEALLQGYDPSLVTYLRSTERTRTPEQDLILLTDRLATFASGSQERLVAAVARLEADVRNLQTCYDRLDDSVSTQRDRIPSDAKMWSISVGALLGVCTLTGGIVAVMKYLQK